VYGYGHQSWVVLIIFGGLFAVRMLASRRRHPGRRGPVSQQGPTGPAGSNSFVDAGPPNGDRASWDRDHGEDGADRGPGPDVAGTAPVKREVAYTGIPAGWFADPSTRHEQRYWSGSEWTENVTDSGVPSTDAPPMAPGQASGPAA